MRRSASLLACRASHQLNCEAPLLGDLLWVSPLEPSMPHSGTRKDENLVVPDGRLRLMLRARIGACPRRPQVPGIVL